MTPPALLIAGHGSRDPAGVGEFLSLSERVRALLPGVEVAGGFIELSSPSLQGAVAELALRGVAEIVAVPLMLLAAGHAKNDIPASIARERIRHPRLRLRYARDLGIHPDLLELVAERAGAAIPACRRPQTTVLMVGRGSSDPDANADLYKIARLIHEGRPYPMVEASFIGITDPSLPAGLERCRRLGAIRIAAVPYFLLTGVLVRRIAEQCAQFAAANPDVEVAVAGHLGPDHRIARLVVERYFEAIRGDSRMNCDLCIHRVALPGFEARVGAPATPHHHPLDHEDLASWEGGDHEDMASWGGGGRSRGP